MTSAYKYRVHLFLNNIMMEAYGHFEVMGTSSGKGKEILFRHREVQYLPCEDTSLW